MKKRLIFFFILLFFLTGFSAHLSNKQTPDPSGNIIAVTKGNLTEKVTAVGNITPKQLVQVKSPISGTVDKLFHDYSDYVEQGEPLLEIKPQPAPSDYAAAKQQVAEDLVTEQAALKDLQRYQFLLKNNAISPSDQEYSNAKKTYDNTVLTRQLDQQKLALLDQGKAIIGGREIANIIKAPISGYIMKRNVDLGSSVVGESAAQAGDTVFTIANMNDLIFEGQVSEIDVAKIHKNMPAVIRVAAHSEHTIPGILTNISLQSEQAGKTASATSDSSSAASPFNVGFDVWITHLKIPANLLLLAGYSATAEITIATAKNILLIPERALQFDNDDKTYVWLNNGKKNQPTKHYITTGISDGINVQVVSGLQLNQEIMADNPKDEANE
jgi:HlyD family secretion protein